MIVPGEASTVEVDPNTAFSAAIKLSLAIIVAPLVSISKLLPSDL